VTRRPDLPRRPRKSEGLPFDPPRSFRMSDELWRRVQHVAARDGLTASFVLAALARDFGAGELRPPKVTRSSETTKSARISAEAWEALKAEAGRLGLPASRVLVGLAQEYADGLIHLHIHIRSSQVELRDVGSRD